MSVDALTQTLTYLSDVMRLEVAKKQILDCPIHG